MERRRPARYEPSEPMTKPRRREKPRERWLLTRKTWKYMSDAGRRLIPDGTQNRSEDLPRIEAYFQDVCGKESSFLLWRKSSYPGALPRPKKKKRPRGGSVRARSPSDLNVAPSRPTDLHIGHISGGRFDIAKLRRDFFAAPPSTPVPASPVLAPEDEDSTLVDLLRKYLKLEEDKGPSRVSESEELVKVLKKFLKRAADNLSADGDSASTTQRTLLDNLSRYYLRSPNRDNIVQDLLTDRNLLKKLYHDLRKTKPYRGGRSGGGSGFGPSAFSVPSSRNTIRTRAYGSSRAGDNDYPPTSPPPLIEVCHESLEDKLVDCGTQTMPIPEDVLYEIEQAYRESLEPVSPPTSPTSPTQDRKPTRRRSSIDHDDVSQSVSDTIKRYFRMARKKSVDADKADRFKRINYDKNLRNIKPKSRGDFDDDGLNKGCQTIDDWVLTYRELRFETLELESTPTSPPSPASPTQSQSFLSSLLGRGGNSPAGSSAGGMQKSRSSSSVVQSVSKRLWRTRSRSSSRTTPTWTPQGSLSWADGSGRCVRLGDCSLLTLTDVESKALQQTALARLQQMNLGATVKVPDETAVAPASKPKRRTYLLKRKALTTGFFDQSRTKDADKDKESTNTSIFGLPLTQCVENERAFRRQQHGGSRASLSSIAALEKGDDSESCDSSDWNWSSSAGGSEDSEPRVPALVNACIAHLRQHGLKTLGLFRVSPSKKRVRQLREDCERNSEAAIDAAACPHDVATLLKEFLRDLPDPLLCRDLYGAFLQTQKIRNRRLQWEAVKLIVQLLPAAHRDTLNTLLTFLSELATHAEDDNESGNKMTAANLATVFAPNILHKQKANEIAGTEQLTERADVINVVRQLIERRAELWTVGGDLLHEAYMHLARSSPHLLHGLLQRRATCNEAMSHQSGVPSGDGTRRVWSREQFLHGATPTAEQHSFSEPSASPRRARGESDTSTTSVSSAMTIVTSRVRSAEESGVHSAGRDSSTDRTETQNSEDDDSCVITASLHIPFPSSSSRPRRDSAVGSSSSANSSPPASPPHPPRAQRVTLTTAGEVRRAVDIDKLVGLGRERNTTDARAVILRHRDDTSTTRTRTRQDTTIVNKREDGNNHDRREDFSRKTDEPIRPERRDKEEKREAVLYKRGELISSAQRPHT